MCPFPSSFVFFFPTSFAYIRFFLQVKLWKCSADWKNKGKKSFSLFLPPSSILSPASQDWPFTPLHQKEDDVPTDQETRLFCTWAQQRSRQIRCPKASLVIIWSLGALLSNGILFQMWVTVVVVFFCFRDLGGEMAREWRKKRGIRNKIIIFHVCGRTI